MKILTIIIFALLLFVVGCVEKETEKAPPINTVISTDLVTDQEAEAFWKQYARYRINIDSLKNAGKTAEYARQAQIIIDYVKTSPVIYWATKYVNQYDKWYMEVLEE